MNDSKGAAKLWGFWPVYRPGTHCNLMRLWFFFARSGMTKCQSFKESLKANPDKAFDLVMRNGV